MAVHSARIALLKGRLKMKFEHTDVWGFEHAIRGMRNPMNSWHKSDSWFEADIAGRELMNINGDYYCNGENKEISDCLEEEPFYFGKNDLDLAQRLIVGGTEHRKFMRQIMVSVDITAPMYWWSEFDTYKVGTAANSTSKMHKLASTPITIDCFETDDYNNDLEYDLCEETVPVDFRPDDSDNENYLTGSFLGIMLMNLEGLRRKYLETKDKRYWKELVRWLPESWLQTRTVTFNYENLRSMYFQRRNHKLTEWHSFVDWLKTLPYSDELITFEKETTE